MTHLSLGVLGSLQVLIDDVPVTMLESDKVYALLVYLSVEANHPHRRETLVGLLWPDHPQQVARHNLRQALFNLRQAIGDHTARPPYLLISREAIQFNRASDFSLDFDQFNLFFQMYEEDQSQVSEDPAMRAARLEEMVKLYRGEFLQDFSLEDCAEFEEWVLVQRERLHQMVMDACSDLASYYELCGNYPAARQYASRQLELDPWREEAHCQMMRVLALDGQRSAALAQYETCRRVLAAELGVEPSANTRELFEQIRTETLMTRGETPSFIPAAPIHNLPVSLMSFIGREQELTDLDQLITNPECRCLSLVGPGGIGKTRLALQTGEQHRDTFTHGVAFIPLAPVDSVEAAITAIASAIHLYFYGPNKPRVQLLNYLCEKQMLLILDNVEHLIKDENPQTNFVNLILEILQGAPGVKLLVTSREVIKLQGEWVFEVGGLAYPDPGQTGRLDEYAAVALFIQRARYAFTEADLAEIAHICRLVEGMPLAIELAATWLRILSPAEIVTEIEGGLDALSAPLHDLPERHRSMRVVFDGSWQKLSAMEQQVLSQLSVFRGGFSRQAAEHVAGASLPILSTFVNRSLLRRASAGRYQLHALIRQYSAAHLTADPQAYTAARTRHFNFFLALAETADQALKGPDQLEWLGRMEQESSNLQAAMEWALESDRTALADEELAPRLSGALRWFWRMRGYFHEGSNWLDRSLQQFPARRTVNWANAVLGKSMLTYALGDIGAACLLAEESAAIHRELGDQHGLAEALILAGVAFIWQGETSKGQARLEEALVIYREASDRFGEARALYRLGALLSDYGGDPTGRTMLEESTSILESLGEKYVFISVLISLGIIDKGLGDYASARMRLEHGLAIARELDHPLGMADALTNLGCVYQILGEYSTAQSYLEESLQVYQDYGCSIWATDVLCALAENAISQGDFSTARFHLQAVSDLLGTSDNKWLQTLVCYFRGLLAYYEGDLVAAAVLLHEAAALAKAGQYKPDLARSLVALASVKRMQGQALPAFELLKEGLDLFQAISHKLGIVTALEEIAAVRSVQGDSLQAAMLFSTTQTMRAAIGAPLPLVDRSAQDSAVAGCRTRLGDAVFENAWAEGKALSLEQAVDLALNRTPSLIENPALQAQGNPPGKTEEAIKVGNELLQTPIEAAGEEITGPGKAPHPDSRLVEPVTKRELEVLNLLAQGSSDKEIAKALFITSETVHKHLKNIYRKLGVHRRTEAIARARQFELL